MQIKIFAELIEWTRILHANLAYCASRHPDERASLLLEYLAAHEAEMEKMVAAFATPRLLTDISMITSRTIPLRHIISIRAVRQCPG